MTNVGGGEQIESVEQLKITGICRLGVTCEEALIVGVFTAEVVKLVKIEADEGAMTLITVGMIVV